MERKEIEKNNVKLLGTVISEGVHSHDVYGESFYFYDLSVKRTSENADIIPVLISNRLVNLNDIKVGSHIMVEGQVRSYNKFENDRNKLILSVFPLSLTFVSDEEYVRDINEVELGGFICKQPGYRKTPLGREISDLLVAINRPYGKSDYVPCITWGRNARFCETLETGRAVSIKGRFQSRVYTKRLEDKEEERTAYEISVGKIETH